MWFVVGVCLSWVWCELRFWCGIVAWLLVLMSWGGGGVADTVLVLARGSCIVFICILFPGTSTSFSKFKIRCSILLSLSILDFLFTSSI